MPPASPPNPASAAAFPEPHAAAWSWTPINAGGFKLDAGGMFGVTPKVLWSKIVQADEHGRMALSQWCLLLRRGRETVLIETGLGPKLTAKERSIFGCGPRSVLDALAEEGVSPASVTAVVLSHLHLDHAGGLTLLDDAGAPTPSFPNARIFTQQLEWDDAIANRSHMPSTYLPSNLHPVADLIEAVDGAAEVLPGLFVEPAPGHTRGQQLVRFNDLAGPVVFPGDVTPTPHHHGARPNMAYDIDPYTASQTRVALLSRACHEGWRLALPHDPSESPVYTASPHRTRAQSFTLRPAALARPGPGPGS